MAQPQAVQKAPLYIVNVKRPYNPAKNTAQGNAATWAIVTKALQASPKGLTAAQITALLKPRNHTTFTGYAIRRKWLCKA